MLLVRLTSIVGRYTQNKNHTDYLSKIGTNVVNNTSNKVSPISIPTILNIVTVCQTKLFYRRDDTQIGLACMLDCLAM